MRPTPDTATPAAAFAAALGGLVALAGAMGIGRFLLTPALPMMAEGAGLPPAAAGLIASANYAGYLLGALAAALPGLAARARLWLVLALAASAASTAAMGLVEGLAPWAALRFAGGLASALVLVTASALVLPALAAGGRPGLSALHFAGVGAGIALSALLAAPGVVAADGWRELWLAGGAATAFALVAAAVLLPRAGRGPAPPAAPAPRPARAGLWRLVAAYGCLGFGYVVTATFIVAMLREGDGGRAAETAIWLAVGLSAIPSVALWTWAGRRIGAIAAFRAAMALEAAGVALSAVAAGPVGLGVAALALGGTFMGLTALGLQEAARRAGGDGRTAMGLMTASFGTGQMLGPALAGWLREATGSYAAPSLLAAAVLVAGALVVAPRRPPAR